MIHMFADSKFKGNISKWNTISVIVMIEMFDGCPIKRLPPWYKE
jgi:hypothetical protein